MTYTIEELKVLFEEFLLTEDDEMEDEIYTTERRFCEVFGGRFIQWLENMG